MDVQILLFVGGVFFNQRTINILTLAAEQYDVFRTTIP